MLVNIKTDSIRKNPEAFKDCFNVGGEQKICISGNCEVPYFLVNGVNFFMSSWSVEGEKIVFFEGDLLNSDFIQRIIEDYPMIVIEVSREVETIYHLPNPQFLYEYENIEIECSNCHEIMMISDLMSDSTEFYDGDDEYFKSSNCICPKCGEWDCCDLEYESIDDALNRKKAIN